MITIMGATKRAEELKKIRKDKIVITKGDRVIYLYPTERVFGEGYNAVVACYDVVFVNKAKGVKINNMSVSYALGSHTVKGYTVDVYATLGLVYWYKGDEIINPILKGYNEKQEKAFYEFVEGAILEELGITE